VKDRDNWQKRHYAKFWFYQVERYGFDAYCKGLFNLLLSKGPQSVYELAIGTGWPFAIGLFDKGVSVSGSDISELLTADINRKYPGISVKAESYEEIKGNSGVKYDIVYCLRSTWYFPDLFKALDTMFSLAKDDGWVLFDIMNKDSDHIQNIVKRHRMLLPYTVAKNIFKLGMNKVLKRNYLVQDVWNIHEIPVSGKAVEGYLNERKISFKKYSINQITDGLESNFLNEGYQNSKIVFECRNNLKELHD
jgi:SAM-dependent methyltransferase